MLLAPIDEALVLVRVDHARESEGVAGALHESLVPEHSAGPARPGSVPLRHSARYSVHEIGWVRSFLKILQVMAVTTPFSIVSTNSMPSKAGWLLQRFVQPSTLTIGCSLPPSWGKRRSHG